MIHATQTTQSPAAVQGATGSPPTASATAPLSSVGSLLPEPSPLLGGDLGAEIAALAVKTGQLENDVDTKAAEKQDALQDTADAAQVSQMHEEASTMRTGAWVSGLLQIGAGACSIAAAGMTLESADLTSVATASAGAATAATDAATAASTAARSWSACADGMKGVSQSLEGGSSLAGGLYKAAETDTEALTAAEKARADEAQRTGGDARTAQTSAAQFVQAAIEFYREYQSTKAQADAAALHGA